jgi:UDP:flavonoid glycosyltransferase YjiC (YdhE family)
MAPRAVATVLSERELFGRLCTAAMLPEMEAAFADWQPELVLREPCEYAAAVCASRRGIPHARVAISQAGIEASALEAAAPALEIYGDRLVEQIRSSPYLTRFPDSLDPACHPDTRRFQELPGRARAALAKWWGDSPLPLVYLSLGSVTGSMPIAAEAYRYALEAVKGLSVRVLLTLGRQTDISELGPVPGNVHVESWVPQDDVFGEARLVICHGGSGTTFGALAAGLPLVIVPLFADHFSNARRVAEAGAGLCVEAAPDEITRRPRLRPQDSPRIAEAVVAVLGDPAYAQAAVRIAREMASLPSAAQILAALRTDLGLDPPPYPSA